MSRSMRELNSVGVAGGRVWVEAFVFDMDGLLFDTEALARLALERTFDTLGAVLTPERHRQLIGLCEAQTSERLRTWLGNEVDCDRFHDECKGRIQLASHDGVPLKPGARALLHRLRALGVPTALATSNSRLVAERNLAQSGLTESFDVVCARDDVSRGKPHPDIFLLAADRLGVAPSRCVALEDSPVGAWAALAAGMATLLVPDILVPPDDLLPCLLQVYEDLDAVGRDLCTPAARPRAGSRSSETLFHGGELGSLS